MRGQRSRSKLRRERPPSSSVVFSSACSSRSRRHRRRATISLGASFVDGHRSAVKIHPIQCGDLRYRLGRLSPILDEAKSFGLSVSRSVTMLDTINGSMCLKSGSNRTLGRTEAEVSCKYISQVVNFFMELAEAMIGQDRTRAGPNYRTMPKLTDRELSFRGGTSTPEAQGRSGGRWR